MNKRLTLSMSILLILALIPLAAGCGGGSDVGDKKPDEVISEPVEQTTGTDDLVDVADTGAATGGDDFLGAVDSGALSVGEITATDYTNETGGMMQMTLTNTTDEKIFVTIPCGIVFGPQDISYQNMMIIQEISVEIGPGATVTVDTFVVCINAELSYPTMGVGYTISGYVDDTDLLALAQCVCQQPVDMFISDSTFNLMSVQTAAWMIRDPEMMEGMAEFGQFAGDIADLAGQMAGGGEEAGEAVAGNVDQLMANMTTGAQAVLDACMIELEGE